MWEIPNLSPKFPFFLKTNSPHFSIKRMGVQLLGLLLLEMNCIWHLEGTWPYPVPLCP
uniref:Uncharacterized protein n=1 Tax=Rhizophora mucronata TaxID=61149 RepID=A0A2P2NHY6_RHIMU